MKNVTSRFALVVVASLQFFSTACVGTKVSYPTTPVPHYDDTKGRRISAEESGFQLLLFIPIGVNQRHQEALGKLQAQARGDYITDISIQDSWTWAFVGTVYRVHMEAIAYPIIAP